MEEKKTSVSNKVRSLKSDLILDAALMVFSRKGVADATLEDIAGEAGFSKASLYNYFPDKDRIFLGVAKREMARFIDVLMNSENDTSISPSLSFEENMRRYMFLRLDYVKKYFQFIISMNLAELFKYENPEKGTLHGYIDFKEEFYQKTLTPIFSWATQKGEMNVLFDNLTLCRIVDGMTLGVIHDWIRNKKVGDIIEITNTLVEFLINGIGKKVGGK